MVQLNLWALKNSSQEDNVSDRYESYNEFSDILLEQEIKRTEEKNTQTVQTDSENFVEVKKEPLKKEEEKKEITNNKKLVSLKHLWITPKNNKDDSIIAQNPQPNIPSPQETNNNTEKQNKVSLKHLWITPQPKKEEQTIEKDEPIKSSQTDTKTDIVETSQKQEIPQIKETTPPQETPLITQQEKNKVENSSPKEEILPKISQKIATETLIEQQKENQDKKIDPPKEKVEEEKPQEKKFIITDWDTNCEFSHTVENEFFVNYVPTYETNNSKKELKEWKIIKLEEKVVKEDSEIPQKSQKKLELTNLQMYLPKIKINKKQYIYMLTSLLFILTITWWITGYNYYNNNLKTSILQTQNTKKTENKITKNDKNIIVKENSQNIVDNNNLKDKITQNKQKVLEQLQKQKQQKLFKNFLINKYGYTTNKN